MSKDWKPETHFTGTKTIRLSECAFWVKLGIIVILIKIDIKVHRMYHVSSEL